MYAMSETRDRQGAPEGAICNEMLRCDVYEVPRELWDEGAFRISPVYLCCPHCSRVGETMAGIHHDAGCPFAEAVAS